MDKRKHSTDAESSDDDAPEAFTFGSSKQAAKGQEDAIRQFEAAEKLKRKEKNRAVDRKLKERAAQAKRKDKSKDSGARATHWEKATKGKGATREAESDEGSEGEDSGRNALEERMARAMREADEEDSEDEEGSAFAGFSDEDTRMGGTRGNIGADEDGEQMSEDDEAALNQDEEEMYGEEAEEEDEDDEDEEMASESEEDEDVAPPTKPSAQKRNYLPDHLFKVLSNPSRNTKITFDDEDAASSHASASPPRKRRRAKRPAKDIVLGSRTVRTLPKPSTAITPAAAKGLPPPRHVQKFLKNSLNTKGDSAKAKAKGWTRRAANLGVMKRDGPAAHFVRTV
ncbi:hypothetical protein BD413DRAFT_601858 [Trametes elegans]|nr:hypothetical protein BD413DRAFT_601858 [Trametes elegans]